MDNYEELTKDLDNAIKEAGDNIEDLEKKFNKKRLHADALSAEIKTLTEKLEELETVKTAAMLEGRELADRKYAKEREIEKLQADKKDRIFKQKRKELYERQPTFIATVRLVLEEEQKKLETGMDFDHVMKDPEKAVSYIERVLNERPSRDRFVYEIREAQARYDQLVGNLVDQAMKGSNPTPSQQNYRLDIVRELLHSHGIVNLWW